MGGRTRGREHTDGEPEGELAGGTVGGGDHHVVRGWARTRMFRNRGVGNGNKNA